MWALLTLLGFLGLVDGMLALVVPHSISTVVEEAGAEKQGQTRTEPVVASTPTESARAVEATVMAPRVTHPTPSVDPFQVIDPSIHGLPWRERLRTIGLALTMGGRIELWQVNLADATARLEALSTNAVSLLDAFPDTARIEVHYGNLPEWGQPHIDLDFHNQSLYLIRLTYSRGDTPPEVRGMIDLLLGKKARSWVDGAGRKCRRVELPSSKRIGMYACMPKRKGRVELAYYDVPVFEKLLKAHLAYEKAWPLVQRGKVLLDILAIDEAVKLFDKALVLVPTLQDARVRRGYARMLGGDFTAARADADEADSRSLSYETIAYAKWLKARLEIVEGRPGEAERLLVEANAMDPWNGDFEKYRKEIANKQYLPFRARRATVWLEDARISAGGGAVDVDLIVRIAGFASLADYQEARSAQESKDPEWMNKILAKAESVRLERAKLRSRR